MYPGCERLIKLWEEIEDLDTQAAHLEQELVGIPDELYLYKPSESESSGNSESDEEKDKDFKAFPLPRICKYLRISQRNIE